MREKIDYELLPSKEIMDIMDGCLLGDGCIPRDRDIFKITSISKEFIDYFEKVFIKNSIMLQKLQITDECIKQFPTNIKPSKCQKKYTLSTRSYKFIKNVRKRWYPNGKKIVPSDIDLNSSSLLYWYLGDGSINYHGGNCWVIELATHGFSHKDNVILQSKLKSAVDVNSHIYPRRRDNKYRMQVSGIKNVIKFFNTIGLCSSEFKNEMGYKFPNIKIINWNGKGNERVIIEKELLESLYWGNQLNQHKIASMLKCSCVTIRKKMKNYKILSRDTRYKTGILHQSHMVDK